MFARVRNMMRMTMVMMTLMMMTTLMTLLKIAMIRNCEVGQRRKRIKQRMKTATRMAG